MDDHVFLHHALSVSTAHLCFTDEVVSRYGTHSGHTSAGRTSKLTAGLVRDRDVDGFVGDVTVEDFVGSHLDAFVVMRDPAC